MKSWLNQNAQINILYLLNPKFHHMAKKISLFLCKREIQGMIKEGIEADWARLDK